MVDAATEQLQQVYEHPDDDAHLLVYADRLQELGDPRGELIVLQLEREHTQGAISERERELLAAHGRRWLGALRPVTLEAGLEYRRGFPFRLRYKASPQAPSGAGAREWLTVREVDCEPHVATDLVGLFLDPMWKHVRRVWGVGQAHCSRLAEIGATLPWVEVGLRGFGHQGPDWLARAWSVFPRLQVLDLLRIPGSPRELFEIATQAPQSCPLRRVTLPLPRESLVDPVHWLQDAPQLEALDFFETNHHRHELSQGARASYQREADGSTRVQTAGFAPDNAQLQELAKSGITQLQQAGRVP